jgi:hypothetical protein
LGSAILVPFLITTLHLRGDPSKRVALSQRDTKPQ